MLPNVKCMRCIQVCEKIQGMGIWTLIGSGYRTTIGLKDNQSFRESDCALAGSASRIVRSARCAKEMTDWISTTRSRIRKSSPSYRWLRRCAPRGESRLVSRIRTRPWASWSARSKIGIDYVFDTNYSADLTIMEEGSEFLERLANRNRHKWPMFTSCCPGWLRFVRTQYPDMVEDLSTAKSPQQMFGAISKPISRKSLDLTQVRFFSISIMPCVAKKFECDVEQVNSAGHGRMSIWY